MTPLELHFDEEEKSRGTVEGDPMTALRIRLEKRAQAHDASAVFFRQSIEDRKDHGHNDESN